MNSRYKLLMGAAVLFLLLITGAVSCKKNDDAAPSLTRVRTVTKYDSVLVTHRVDLGTSYTSKDVIPQAFDSTVTAGPLGGLFAIIGTNLQTTTSVSFNGYSVYFNPTLVTNTSIIVKIPDETPWLNGDNKLVVTTKYGTASIDFTVLQPAPAIKGLSQFAGNPGDTVTITGTVLDNASVVKFGAATAKIVSTTSTALKVIVPANALGVTSVTTPGGSASGPYASYNGVVPPIAIPFGFKSLLYEDAVPSDGFTFGFIGWNANTQSTEVVKRGPYSIRVDYTGNYAGYAVGSGPGIDLTGVTYVKFSIYGGSAGTEGKVIKVALNDFDHRQVSIILHENVWSTYVIPLKLFQDASAPGTPTTLSYLGFQELSASAPETIFLDDIGVY
jgi:hypothetical protein